MKFFTIIITIITICLTNACAVVEPAGSSKAVRDEQRALGMVLVEQGDQQLLKLVVCNVQGELLPEGAMLADETQCPNAFVDAEGNGYYFSELQPRGLQQQLFRSGYLRLGSLLLIPVAIGTVVGWQARPLIKKLKLIVTSEGKLHIDRGARSSKAVTKAAQAQSQALANVSANTKVGAAGGVIMAFVTHRHLRDHLWGKGERLTTAYWDDIFRLHFSFTDAKMLENPKAITHILDTLAQALKLEVNPAVIAHD